MKRASRNLAKVGAVTLLVSVSTIGMGGTSDAAAADTLAGMGKKLVRGVVNAATGWMELPKAIFEESIEKDPFTGLVFGTLEGSAKTIWRTGAGGYEAGTFFVPLPDNFQPVTNPETVLGNLE